MSDSVVFISHAEEDRDTAMALCAALEAATVRCWIAPRDISPGESYLDAINHGLDLARIVIVLVSDHANESKWVLREVERATNRNTIVIPARLRETTPNQRIGLLLSTLQWVDVGDGSSPQAFTPLIAAVNGSFKAKSSLDDLKANDAALNLAAVTSILGGLLVGAWGTYSLLFVKTDCVFFGQARPCSMGGGYLVVAAFCVLLCGAALWTRSRSAVMLAWLSVLMLAPGTIDGVLYRYRAFAAPAVVLGVMVPIAIAWTVTRRRNQFR